MAYTTTQLITNAYYLSGVVSREFETVSGTQFTDGLESLNDVIGDKTSDKSMIPYFLPFNFTTVIGQEKYFIPHLIEATSITFTLNTVRYAMFDVDRDAYFGLPRAQGIESLPFNYHVERCYGGIDPITQVLVSPPVGGANIFFYFLPQENYPIEVWGKYELDNLVLGQDLSLTIDRFYINYLKYALADYICNNYNYTLPQRSADKLEELEGAINKRSGKLDLVIRQLSTLDSSPYGVNYGQANLGKGWSIP